MIPFVMPSMTKIPREPVHHPLKSRMRGIFYQTQKCLLSLLKTKKEEKKEISIKQGWEGYSKTVFPIQSLLTIQKCKKQRNKHFTIASPDVGRTDFLTVNFR